MFAMGLNHALSRLKTLSDLERDPTPSKPQRIEAKSENSYET